MNNSMLAYSNPRIDGQEVTANALEGEVSLDKAKLLWIASMIVFGTVGSMMTASVAAIALFVCFTLLTLCLGHSLGMHRRFIHRSYQCPKWLEYFFVHLGVIVGIAGPYGMLCTHDLRDWAQRQKQCHDYFSHAQPWYRDFYWQIFCSIKLQHPPAFNVEKSIVNDRVYMWMERTWMLQQLPWACLFFCIGGWGWVFWGVCSRVTASVLGHWLIGYFAHNHGERRWHVVDAAAQGYNIPLAALITMGESWHNNHHAYPGSAKLGLEAGQWDPGWWVLLMLQRVGLAHNFITNETLPERCDLVPANDAHQVSP